VLTYGNGVGNGDGVDDGAEVDDGARVGSAELAALLRDQLPGYPVKSIIPLGEGQENTAFEVNSELVLRVSKEPDPIARRAVVEREARLVDIVAGYGSLPIPRPLFVADGAMAYRKVPGVPLLSVTADRRRAHGTRIARALGRFLAEIQSIPVDLVAELVGSDDDCFSLWMTDAAESWAVIESVSAVATVLLPYRPSIQLFLAAVPPDPRPGLVFSHNDLGIEHVLVDPRTLAVTGVIDFSDAALVDPAYDFGLILRDLGPDAFDAAVRAAGETDDDRTDFGGAEFRARALLYARCSVLEDLQYGLEHNRQAYVDKSLDSIPWLFPR